MKLLLRFSAGFLGAVGLLEEEPLKGSRCDEARDADWRVFDVAMCLALGFTEISWLRRKSQLVVSPARYANVSKGRVKTCNDHLNQSLSLKVVGVPGEVLVIFAKCHT